MRACRLIGAGAAWLLDYIVAVGLSAWDSVAVSRTPATRGSGTAAQRRGDPKDAPRPLLRPGTVAASLAVFGVVSLSVLGAHWRHQAPEGAALPTAVIDQSVSVLGAVSPRWAPVIQSSAVEPGDGRFSLSLEASATAAPPEPATPAIPEPEASQVSAATVEETPAPTQPPAPTPTPPPAATPAPTATPAPAPPPRAAALTRDQVHAAALTAGWPESEIPELLSVAWCESNYRPDANGWGALGLMQIMPFWFSSLGIDVSWAFDPVTNLRVAYHIYQNDLRNGYGEWASWSCKP